MIIIILEKNPFLTDIGGFNKNDDFGKIEKIVIIYL